MSRASRLLPFAHYTLPKEDKSAWMTLSEQVDEKAEAHHPSSAIAVHSSPAVVGFTSSHLGEELLTSLPMTHKRRYSHYTTTEAQNYMMFDESKMPQSYRFENVEV